jgi:carbonic anhydrase
MPAHDPPHQLLERLHDGNARFASDAPIAPNRGSDHRKAIAYAQSPFAVIVACSDSRMPVEMVFDQGFGDLFVVRLAGHVLSPAAVGSVEFAVDSLGARLVMILGHTRCSAVKVTMEVIDKYLTVDEQRKLGHVAAIIDAIRPAVVRAFKHEGDAYENAIRENVRGQVEELIVRSPSLRQRARDGEIEVVGSMYDLDSGLVRDVG